MSVLLPSSATRNISILAPDVATTLTISAPTSRNAGTGFNITGILTRNDTGGPVPNASIELSYDGTVIGTVTTGIDGDYIRFLNIQTPGTYSLNASFAGGTGFSASMATRNISVGIIESLTPLLIPIAIGIAALFLLKK